MKIQVEKYNVEFKKTQQTQIMSKYKLTFAYEQEDILLDLYKINLILHKSTIFYLVYSKKSIGTLLAYLYR